MRFVTKVPWRSFTSRFDLPVGPVIARQSHLLVAVVGGVAHDTWDCTAKRVYGYWAKASSSSSNAGLRRQGGIDEAQASLDQVLRLRQLNV